MLKKVISVAVALSLLLCVLPAQAASGSLRTGSRGTEVTRLQNALKSLGMYSLKVDGIFGKGTRSAVMQYQRKNGLTVDGIAGPKTLGKLYASSGSTKTTTKTTSQKTSTTASGTKTVKSSIASPGRLQYGDKGNEVKDLQDKLRYIGCYTGSSSGTFDAKTKTAVLSFQQAKGLSRDGIAGPKTLKALETAWSAAKKAAGSLPDETVSLLNRIAVESGAVCGTVVLSKDGKTFLTWSFGGVSQKTCFRIASITKWVTAIGLMTLYDQGKLDLDKDISDYLPFKVRNPAFPNTKITARMLLTHTSSLSPDASVYKPKWENISRSYDPIFNESIKPGTRYAYADYNGALFGCLIEAITGESVQKYLDRTVFKPLGLTAAYSPNFLPSGTPTKDTLKSSGRVGLSVAADRNASYNNRADPRGNNGYTVGRLYINTASLTKLAQMMLAGGELNGVRILERATVSLMEADQPGLAESRYGLSTVRLNQFPRGTWYGHQGRYSGLSSNVYYQIDTGITLALVMDGYDYKLEDNIVMPAVTLMKNMEKIEKACIGAE